MIDRLTASDICNEMSMMRSVFKGTYLVVEGVSDSRLYGKFTDTDKVKVMIAHSKNNVMNTVSTMANKRKDPGVVGIVDRDMDSLQGKKRFPPLFSTDRRDLESTLLSTGALDDILAEYGDAEKMRHFSEKFGPISEAILDAAVCVGFLMYISYRKGMNLSFKDLDYSYFVNPVTLKVDLSKLVAHVYAISMGQRYPRATVVEFLSNMIKDWGASWDYARGHDAVAILNIGLRRIFGGYNSKNLSDGELSGALRLAYSGEYFRGSKLYETSGNWCKDNGLALWR